MPILKPIIVARGMKYPNLLGQDHIFPLELGGGGISLIQTRWTESRGVGSGKRGVAANKDTVTFGGDEMF